MLRSWIHMRKRQDAAFTLLEYCAGAAVLLTIVWLGLNSMGTGMQTMLNKIGEWATTESAKMGE